MNLWMPSAGLWKLIGGKLVDGCCFLFAVFCFLPTSYPPPQASGGKPSLAGGKLLTSYFLLLTLSPSYHCIFLSFLFSISPSRRHCSSPSHSSQNIPFITGHIHFITYLIPLTTTASKRFDSGGSRYTFAVQSS